jgi:hypothetical protein
MKNILLHLYWEVFNLGIRPKVVFKNVVVTSTFLLCFLWGIYYPVLGTLLVAFVFLAICVALGYLFIQK